MFQKCHHDAVSKGRIYSRDIGRVILESNKGDGRHEKWDGKACVQKMEKHIAQIQEVCPVNGQGMKAWDQ